MLRYMPFQKRQNNNDLIRQSEQATSILSKRGLLCNLLGGIYQVNILVKILVKPNCGGSTRFVACTYYLYITMVTKIFVCLVCFPLCKKEFQSNPNFKS